MKKSGIINAQLAGLIAGLGHKDTFLIADGGMPIPKGIEIVDLALCGGIPAFEPVMKAILAETEVEHYYLAEEILEKNAVLFQVIQKALDGVAYEMIPHDRLKEMTKDVKFAVRTGEFTPYPNIILKAGVAFPA